MAGKKKGMLFTILPIAIIVAGLVMVALPFLENQQIEQAQSDVVGILEEMARLYDASAPPEASGAAKGSSGELKEGPSGEPTVGSSGEPKVDTSGEPEGGSSEGEATNTALANTAPANTALANTAPANTASANTASANTSPVNTAPETREADIAAELQRLARSDPSLHVSEDGRVFVDMEINTDEEVGYDAFTDPESGEVIESLPELGALDADKMRVEIIGRVHIPSIECYYYVVDGSGKTELKYAIGHWRSSAYIGEMGNTVLPGHRNYTYGQYFNRLDEVKAGDRVEVYDMRDNLYVYEIDRVFLVEPQDLYANLIVLSGEEMERRITLSTCHPVRVASHRLLVQGKLIEGPEWTRQDAYPLDPARADAKAMAAKIEELRPYREARLFSGVVGNMRSLMRLKGIQAPPDAVALETEE